MSAAFKGRHFAPDIIWLCMRWYCRYMISYRDLEEMMAERHLSGDHTTIYLYGRLSRCKLVSNSW